MRPWALAVVMLVAAGCSSETGETMQAVEVPDAQLEASQEDAPDADAGPEASPEAAPETAPDAAIDSGHDSPEKDSAYETGEAAVDAALDAVSEPDASPTCVPVYTVKDSNTVTASGGATAVTVVLECAPGEKTASGHWLGLCELSGDFDTACTCTHIGDTGVKCGALTSSTGTVTLTIWCERSCD